MSWRGVRPWVECDSVLPTACRLGAINCRVMSTSDKTSWHIARLIPRAFLGLAVLAAASPAVAAIRNVDCTKGETITTALTDAVPGDTIRVTGTCRERITITTDRLTLDGQDRTILDGGGGTRLSSQGW